MRKRVIPGGGRGMEARIGHLLSVLQCSLNAKHCVLLSAYNKDTSLELIPMGSNMLAMR